MTPHYQTSYSDAAAVTTSDTVSNVFARLYIGGAGDVKVTTRDGTAVVFKAVPLGTVLPIQTNLVWATGTTATLITGLI